MQTLERAGGSEHKTLLPPKGCDTSYPTPDDVERLKEELLKKHPDCKAVIDTTWTTGYIRIVMTRASKEDSNVMRSFDYSLKKLSEAYQLRSEFEVEKLFPSHTDISELSEVPESIKDAIDSGSLYWRDYDIYGRPILWVRNNLKDFRDLDIEAEKLLHIWMLEWGIRSMPPGVHQFVIVADAREMTMRQLMQLSFVKMLMKVFMKLYPDRISHLYSGPVSMLLRKLYSLTKPLLPRNVQGKIRLLPSDPVPTLQEFLSEDVIPMFFGGTSPHTDLVSTEGKDMATSFNFTQMRDYQIDILSGMSSAFHRDQSKGLRALSDLQIEDENA
eukprot:CAMPEP_0184499618 /NCGR_PEP_ID=MMETSP0113_2-20130426/41977_1 /TAXON_ID=91329 /ORGANISM="Norrisiella sphaerica, Strain BC52" /LENGTH=328 /DNA_ID=CAMNT_0026887591 /DNA_START=149 /DNA_END=1132 /DNA_ORIENTATION=+